MYINTPLLESLSVSSRCGRRVWLKMEALQPSGSFKTRGLGHACQEYKRRGATRFVASSGGNAGLAVAYAGRCLGVPVTCVVPESTTQRAKDLIQQEGAQVIVRGESWQEAHQYALSLVDDTSAYLHPFDDPLIWEGNSSLVTEVIEAGVMPGAVVLSVGGGGLLCGVVEGLQRSKLSHVPVFAAETFGADSLYKAVKAGELIELPAITSVATTLGAKRVAAHALELSRKHPIFPHRVSDGEAVDACIRFAEDHRVITEPSCGASLALVYNTLEALADYDDILVVVCGGAGITYPKLVELRDKLQ
jgi:L-serine/L-threonine ammonia-lyase